MLQLMESNATLREVNYVLADNLASNSLGRFKESLIILLSFLVGNN